MRYSIRRPRSDSDSDDAWRWWSSANDDARSLTVFEPESKEHPTGLLDQHGNELYAIAETEPVGFILLRERT